MTDHGGATESAGREPAASGRAACTSVSTPGFEFVARGGHRINSLLALRDGRLLLETYQPPYRAETTQHLYSATKSFLSALVGIAIGDGLVEGVDQPIVELLPDRTQAPRDPRATGITLRHALTMTTGLEWGELALPYVHPKNPVRRMQESADWVRYVLERRLVATPGATFDYNSGASHLIAAALQNAAGTTVAAYADERLFRPLGIRTWHWTADPAGVNTGGWGLHLRPRDMVRFGELYLNAGRWDGREVISEVWIRESTSCHVKAVPDGRRGDRLRSFGRRVLGRPAGPAAVDYGYHWWLPDVGCHAALGSAGQAIYVLADERLVVAMTGGLRTSESSLRRELIEQRVLPALRSAAPAGDGQLVTTAGAGGLRRTASSALPELPPTAHLVSAQTYVFGENPSRIESLSLRFGRDGEATLDVLLEGRRYELAVGLDRSYRETMIDERNRLALRGAWVDDRTFALEWCWTSSGERLDISLRFARDRVSFRARGAIDGHTRRMVGRLRRP